MATASISSEADRGKSIPWYLWCVALAVTSVTIGAHWDVSWHRSIGRDTFWTPAHLAIYLCGVLAGICCGYLILNTTFRRPAELVASSVSVFGFRGPLGAFLAAWGGVAMLTSAPFDNWWHNAYGLDVKIVSPPHTLLIFGIFAVEIGAFFLIAAAMNRAGQARSAKLQWLLLYLGGLMLVLGMFFRMEYTWDIRLHSAAAYISVALGVPTYFAMFWECSRNRWAGTWTAGLYMLFLIGLILLLPLFPAEPKLGPVYQAVHQFIPPKFPLLLIVPAFALDLLLQKTEAWKLWLRSSGGRAVVHPFASGSRVAICQLFDDRCRKESASLARRTLIIRRRRNPTTHYANFSGPSTVLFFGKALRWRCSTPRSALGSVLR